VIVAVLLMFDAADSLAERFTTVAWHGGHGLGVRKEFLLSEFDFRGIRVRIIFGLHIAVDRAAWLQREACHGLSRNVTF
jgi:hypothetical protein